LASGAGSWSAAQPCAHLFRAKPCRQRDSAGGGFRLSLSCALSWAQCSDAR
jgi:hypothetical protein